MEQGCDERWQVERCKNSHGVAESKEGEARQGDGSCNPCGTEDLCELTVFVEAERHINACCCNEFRRAGGCSCGGDVA